MRTSFAMTALLAALMAGSALAADKPRRAGPAASAAAPPAMPMRECNPGGPEQECCSAAKCTGSVLSNRDFHNCKVKSSGKSWHAAGSATCLRT